MPQTRTISKDFKVSAKDVRVSRPDGAGAGGGLDGPSEKLRRWGTAVGEGSPWAVALHLF